MTLKSDLYNLLKDSPAELTTTYQQYTVEQLVGELKEAGIMVADVELPEVVAAAEVEAPDLILPDDDQPVVSPEPPPITSPAPNIPVRGQDPAEMPGQRLNTQPEDEPIRIDDLGRAWFQEEVRKPSYPKPRGRRVLKYMERGTRTETVQNGEYVETFEVAGEGSPHPAEVKITLPSYQVGIYKDPRFPFKIHCYNDREGFNFFEVAEFYGGVELVPQECKRVYVENDLCYDIRSVVRAIQNEHRQLQLMGKIQ